jgi:hypothetical protein
MQVKEPKKKRTGTKKQCPICKGRLRPLGMLACMMHYRCENCGMMVSRDEGGCG